MQRIQCQPCDAIYFVNKSPDLLSPLTEAELDELDHFLLNSTSSDEAMILEQCSVLAEAIPECVANIYRFWQPYRYAMLQRNIATQARRHGVKVGRSDPCPCGSGKKCKKYCGAAEILH